MMCTPYCNGLCDGGCGSPPIIPVSKWDLYKTHTSEMKLEGLKEITDNEDEYNLLYKVISTFYTTFIDYDHEVLLHVNYEGNVFVEGKYRKVTIPDEIWDFPGKFVMSIHNHHGELTCFQSMGDYSTTFHTLEKYAITIAYDGILITKRNGFCHRKNVEDSLRGYYISIMEEVKRKFPSFSEFSNDEFETEMNIIISSRIQEELEKINMIFKREHIPLKSYYLKI